MSPGYKALAYLLAAALCAGAGYQVCDWRMSAQINEKARQATQDAFDDYRDVVKDRDALATRLAASDKAHTEELRKAQNETNRLRARDAAGALGLHVAATCPPATTASAAPGAGVDSGAGAELAGPARQAYFALREGLDLAGRQLAACQDELRQRVAP